MPAILHKKDPKMKFDPEETRMKSEGIWGVDNAMGQVASNVQADMQQRAASAAVGGAQTAAGNEVRGLVGRFNGLTMLRTVVGYVAVFGVWSAAIAAVSGVSTIFIGIYLFFFAIPVTLLELAFFFNKLTFCASDEGPVGRVRGMLERVDSWKRGILYCVAAIPCFIPLPFVSIFAVLFALCIFFLGILYCAKPFQKVENPPDQFDNAAGPPRSESGKVQDPAQYNSPAQYNQYP